MVALPALGHSSSGAAVGNGAEAAQAGTMQRSASLGNISKQASAPESLPGLVTAKFQPGVSGLNVQGSLVTRAALQSWMKGVRPGWTIKMIAGKVVQEDDDTEVLLQQAADNGSRYEVRFQKGASKFGIQADIAGEGDREKERNRARVRRTFPFQGHIEKVEHRGITPRQLDRVLAFAQDNFSKWTDTMPNKKPCTSGQKLRMHSLNLHHVNAWIIQPATEGKKCAFVELLTAQKQSPSWFVTHWWGEPIVDFTESLRAHVAARRQTPDTPYWICAYANRQHQLQESLSVEADVTKTCFAKALHAARYRMLVVLDVQATAFSRLWCAFEGALCLPRANAPLDIAACKDARGRVLTHGFTEEEEEMEQQVAGTGLRAKATREADFPLEVVEAALGIDFEKAETTYEEDRPQVLNYIVGADDLDEPPVEGHPKYAELSTRLRALFVVPLLLRITSLEATVPNQQRWAPISEALRADVWRKAMDLCYEGLSSNGMRLLAESLPPNLQELTLRIRGSNVKDEDMLALADGFPDSLKAVSLDLRHCRHITSAGAEAFKASAQKRRVACDLNLLETEALRFEQECERPRKAMAAAFGVSLCLHPENCRGYKHRVVPAVPALVRALERAEKPATRCAALRALASLGDSALEAVPVMEKVAIDDVEPSVQNLAKAAVAKVRGTTATAE
eukprot:TRINITY_DN19894_c0_g1_i1.p1 TRINITY_DN19894_c0_g1~~TRINITY_DN19894_c0_g1_i1.p1  ORF type:complete len:695 (+),score=131.89 TRINITY_DN19894_c0_g1_i1:48-2087(+)